MRCKAPGACEPGSRSGLIASSHCNISHSLWMRLKRQRRKAGRSSDGSDAGNGRSSGGLGWDYTDQPVRVRKGRGSRGCDCGGDWAPPGVGAGGLPCADGLVYLNRNTGDRVSACVHDAQDYGYEGVAVGDGLPGSADDGDAPLGRRDRLGVQRGAEIGPGAGDTTDSNAGSERPSRRASKGDTVGIR